MKFHEFTYELCLEKYISHIHVIFMQSNCNTRGVQSGHPHQNKTGHPNN